MGFRLANIDGRAALVAGENYYDLATISNGELSDDPMQALEKLPTLSALNTKLSDFSASGLLADAVLCAPVPEP